MYDIYQQSALGVKKCKVNIPMRQQTVSKITQKEFYLCHFCIAVSSPSLAPLTVP